MDNEKEAEAICALQKEIQRMKIANAISSISTPILRFLLWCAKTIVYVLNKLSNLVYEFPEES